MGNKFKKDYSKGKKLGEGLNGEVYQCVRKVDKTPVAVMICSKAQILEWDLQRIRDNMNILRKCNHKNIVNFYEFVEDTENLYLIMELVDGQNLQQFQFAQMGKANYKEMVLEVFVQTLLALNYLHQSKIIHRNINPSAIIIDKNGHTKLIGFSCAKILESAEDKRRSSIYGSPDYCPPEFLNYNSFSYNADVWQLGKVLEWLCDCLNLEDLNQVIARCLVEDRFERADTNELLVMPLIQHVLLTKNFPKFLSRMENQFYKQYTKVKKLGEGGFGKVYQCIRIIDNQPVAIKITNKEHVLNDQDLSRVTSERDFLKKSSHTNIVAFYDFFEDNRKYYIVMELAEGGTLKQILAAQKSKALAVENILDIFCQLLLAVNHLHINQIVHRDIKPDNIFIGKNGRIKLGDLGSGKTSDSDERRGSVFSVSSIRNEGYMAPEVQDWGNSNFNSDVWSLGVVLRELSQDTKSEDLDQLIECCLVEDKNQRPQVKELLTIPYLQPYIQKAIETNKTIK